MNEASRLSQQTGSESVRWPSELKAGGQREGLGPDPRGLLGGDMCAHRLQVAAAGPCMEGLELLPVGLALKGRGRGGCLSEPPPCPVPCTSEPGRGGGWDLQPGLKRQRCGQVTVLEEHSLRLLSGRREAGRPCGAVAKPTRGDDSGRTGVAGTNVSIFHWLEVGCSHGW